MSKNHDVILFILKNEKFAATKAGIARFKKMYSDAEKWLADPETEPTSEPKAKPPLEGKYGTATIK